MTRVVGQQRVHRGLPPQAFLGALARGDADVPDDWGGLVPDGTGALQYRLPGSRGAFWGHPIEEDGVANLAGQPAHLWPHGGHRQARSRQQSAQLLDPGSDGSQWMTVEAGTNAKDEPRARQAKFLDAVGDLGGVMPVERQHSHTQVDGVAVRGPAAQLQQPFAPVVVVAPDRDVAERLSLPGQWRQ